MPLDLSKESIEQFANHLVELADKLRSGKIALSNITSASNYERWYHKDKWEYFRTIDTTMKLEYYNVEFRNQEIERRDRFIKDNPTASKDGDPIPVISLNGIPRGVCYDYNTSEGWIKYVVPKSGNQSDYEVGNAEMELRQYFGKVEIMGYLSADGNNPEEYKKFYGNIPANTPTFPVEAYEVLGNPYKQMGIIQKSLKGK